MWADLQPRVGQQVTVTGTALNASAGAIVSLDGGPVYIDGLRAWPDELFGQEVEATGTLVFRPGPAPGTPTHRLADSYALEGASWSAAGQEGP